MAKVLDDRIASALGPRIASAIIDAVLADARAALAATEQEHDEAERLSLDPHHVNGHAHEALEAKNEAAFARDRLEVAIDRLQGRLGAAKQAEQLASDIAAYDAVKAERDALAAEFRDQYPALAGKVIDLLERVTASEKKIHAINNKLSSGRPWLNPTEAEARKCAANYGGGNLQITKTIELPAFDGIGFLWRRGERGQVWRP